MAWPQARQEMSSRTFSAAAVVEGGGAACIGIQSPKTNMETQKGPYKDYSPSKTGLYGFPC